MTRRYLFIDESGDPGSESSLFIVAVVDLSDGALHEYRRLLAGYRYHNELHAEMKAAGLNRSHRPFLQGCQLFRSLLDRNDAACTVGFVTKAQYTGPYLGRDGDVQSVKFRNFTTRMVLESHYATNPVGGQTEVEFVFDRVSLARALRDNLERYFATNFRLPTIHHFTHVDSRYVDGIFLPDFAVTVVKDWLKGETSEQADSARAFMEVLDLTEP